VPDDVIPPAVDEVGEDGDSDVVDVVEGVITKGVEGMAVATGSVLVTDGTSGDGLIPALPISNDPNGIPVRAAPLGVTGDVAAIDDALLFEVVPHGADAAVLPGIDVPAPIPIPPPSKVVVEPDMAVDAAPAVEQGNGLSPGEASCVAPIGIPIGPTDALGPMPRGDVIPMEGVVAGLVCASASPALDSVAAMTTAARKFMTPSCEKVGGS
jgi:hypothetical protein